MDRLTGRRGFLETVGGLGTAWAASPIAVEGAEAPPEVRTAREARLAMRRGEWRGPTVNKLPGCVQCNLVVLSKVYAYDFLHNCQRNPKPCPLMEVTDPGSAESKLTAPGADLRTDLPRYAAYRDGVQGEDLTDIRGLWREDSVAFLIGSSLTFDHALERAGVPRDPLRPSAPADGPAALTRQVWVLETKLPTAPAGIFRGPLVVTMRWMTPAQAVIATQLTSRFPFNHGAPVHIGDPEAIGADLVHPIYGEPVREIPRGILPVFWACGVTPQRTALLARPELMITHSPGHGFITDLLADQVCLP